MDRQVLLADALRELGESFQFIENMAYNARQAVYKAHVGESSEEHCRMIIDWTQLVTCEMVQALEAGIQETMQKCAEINRLLPQDKEDAVVF